MIKPDQKINTIFVAIICILLFIIGFSWSYNNNKFFYYPQGVNQDGGTHLKFVYLGSSHCGFSNNVRNHDNIIAIKKHLKNALKSNDKSFITTGISVDFNAYKGIKYLKKTGPYDEIISGSNWFNNGAKTYIWETFQGNPSTPQIILVKSEIEVEAMHGIVQTEEVLKRISGINEIENTNATLTEMSNQEIIQWLEI